MKTGTAQEFALQMIKPLTFDDFQGMYGNGMTHIQNEFGQNFALEAANYSASALGNIGCIWGVTRRLMIALAPLNDEHFTLGFNRFKEQFVEHFSQEKNCKPPFNLESALNVLSNEVWRIERSCVKQFLEERDYDYPTKNDSTNKPKMK